jgi:hypothetical protein
MGEALTTPEGGVRFMDHGHVVFGHAGWVGPHVQEIQQTPGGLISRP